jgi:hypothetical protein
MCFKIDKRLFVGRREIRKFRNLEIRKPIALKLRHCKILLECVNRHLEEISPILFNVNHGENGKYNS